MFTLFLGFCRGVKVKCTLWDDFAKQFLKYVVGINTQHHVVIILQFGRIRDWQGKLIFIFYKIQFIM